MGDRVFSRERSPEPASQLTSSLFLAKASGTNLKMLQDAHAGNERGRARALNGSLVA